MYRPAAYAIDDLATLHETIRLRDLATVAAIVQEQLHFAYAPVVLDKLPAPFGSVRFHLARGNPLAEVDGLPVHFSFLAADAYVSPDWYETKGFVPTWNYVAVEASGRARMLDEGELRQLLVDLSAAAEEKLRPKPPWNIGKIAAERLSALLSGIRGFSVNLELLEGKFKLSQDKKPADVIGVIAAMEAREDPASRAIARAMKLLSRGDAEAREEP